MKRLNTTESYSDKHDDVNSLLGAHTIVLVQAGRILDSLLANCSVRTTTAAQFAPRTKRRRACIEWSWSFSFLPLHRLFYKKPNTEARLRGLLRETNQDEQPVHEVTVEKC